MAPSGVIEWLHTGINSHLMGINKLLATNDSLLCTHIIKQRIDQSNWYKQSRASAHGVSLEKYGFFGMTYALLMQALNNSKNGKPLGTPTSIQLPASIYGKKPLSTKFTQQEIEAFISIAPLPLYRAINIAAVYPAIGFALIQNITELVAAHYASAYLNQTLLNTNAQGNHSSGLVGLPLNKLQQLQQALSAIRQRLHKHVNTLLSHRQAAQAWTKQVDRIQEKLYADAMHR